MLSTALTAKKRATLIAAKGLLVGRLSCGCRDFALLFQSPFVITLTAT